MLVLVFDLETTGLLEDENSTITEMAYIIYDIGAKRDVKAKSYLVGTNLAITQEIEELTGITNALLDNYGCDSRHLCSDFTRQVDYCNGIVFARNGEGFDIPMLKRFFGRHGYEMPEVTCLDDYLDLEYPANIKGKNLSHIAADHGFINMRPHSGLSDVMSSIAIMERGDYSWEKMLESAKSKVIEVQALVDFHQKDLAKEMKFIWEPGTKRWIKRLREYKHNSTNYGFPTVVLNGG